MVVFLLITYRHRLNRVYNIYQLHDAVTKPRGSLAGDLEVSLKQIMREACEHAPENATQLATVYVRIAETIPPQLPQDIFRKLSEFQLIRLYAKSTHFHTKNEPGIQVSAFTAVLVRSITSSIQQH